MNDDLRFDSDPCEPDEVSYRFELIASFDGKITTLICRSSEQLDMIDYATALREFAAHLEGATALGKFDAGSIS